MKVLAPLAFIAALASGGLATKGPKDQASIASFNPFKGQEFFLSPQWRPKVLKAAATFVKEGKWDLSWKATKVAQVSTWIWISKIADIETLEGYLREARVVQTITRKPHIFQLEVYNLPDRDCSAKASAGELSYANNGAEIYKKKFIDPIAAILAKYPDVRVALGLETDAVGNLVTNLAVPKCGNAAEEQKKSMAYAIAKFQLPNVAIYLDGAHAGWLGWPDNLAPTAKILTDLIKEAKKINPKSVVRGVATNVSNYNGLGNNEQAGRDELKYVRDLAPLLAAQGWDAHFIVDQGRSGNQTAPREGGDWCNFASAGFGPRPTANTPDPLIDAIVWVKPGGEGDGTSDVTAPRYDEACGAPTSLKPAPEAGTWFQAYFELLIKQANPAF